MGCLFNVPGTLTAPFFTDCPGRLGFCQSRLTAKASIHRTLCQTEVGTELSFAIDGRIAVNMCYYRELSLLD